MDILRIDNVFFNSFENASLADFYSRLIGRPLRRSQEEAPGVMWVEIGIGGMELSFRKAEKTAEIHPHLGKIFEVPPGRGATISFETADTDRSRRRLESLGVPLHGDPIICTGGQEIISIFSDPAGRPVQFYEPRFEDLGQVAVAGRETFMTAPTPLSDRPVLYGSNIRALGALAYSVAMTDTNFKEMAEFYGELLELPQSNSWVSEYLHIDLDGAILEFRPSDMQDAAFGLLVERAGHVIPLLEVADLDSCIARLAPEVQRQARRSRSQGSPGRATLFDPDGNAFELWERPWHDETGSYASHEPGSARRAPAGVVV